MSCRLDFVLLFAVFSLPQAQALEADPKLKDAYQLLSHSETGKQQLSLAESMSIPVISGRVSRTDITATRIVNGTHEELKFMTEVMVAQNKEPVFQALDLVHELVHATHPKNNPFDPGLDLATYVKRGIEDAGGEADAIAEECKVGQELIEAQAVAGLKDQTVQLITARCQFVWQTVPDEQKWKHSFYYLGQHYRDFMKSVIRMNLSSEKTSAWFKKIEAKSPMFASAVAHKPYPVALLEEYVDITTKICEKSKGGQAARSIASLSLLAERCNSVGVNLNP